MYFTNGSGVFNISQVGTFVSRYVKRVHSVSGQKKNVFLKQIQNLTTLHKTKNMLHAFYFESRCVWVAVKTLANVTV